MCGLRHVSDTYWNKEFVHHVGKKCYNYMEKFHPNLHTTWSPTKSDIYQYTRGRIDTIDSPDDEHLVDRNM